MDYYIVFCALIILSVKSVGIGTANYITLADTTL